MPVIFGVAIVQVCSISGGATISPKRDAAAASGSMYTGFASSNAAAQCRIIGWFTGSGATFGPPAPIGWPDERRERVVEVGGAGHDRLANTRRSAARSLEAKR